MLLAQKPRREGFGLVPKRLVEVHEHEFGNLRDMDDLAGSQVRPPEDSWDDG